MMAVFHTDSVKDLDGLVYDLGPIPSPAITAIFLFICAYLRSLNDQS